jgi:sugar phosphate isomerase/epimerase
VRFSFSTLGCPAWGLDEILSRARGYGFDGIAFRGLEGELDLTRVAAFRPERRAETRARIAAAGLEVTMVLASARMMIADPAELAASQADAKRHIDIAAGLGAPFVRVFGGPVPSGLSRAAAVRRAGDRLRELGDHAAPLGVAVLLETHDDWLDPTFVRRALEAADHPAVRALWDVHHPWRIAGLDPETVWRDLRPWIAAVDVKDSVEDFTARLGYRYVKLGEGEVPWPAALRLLRDGGYDGWLTFEWEKMWHPEIEGPEIAFPHFRRAIEVLLDRSR